MRFLAPTNQRPHTTRSYVGEEKESHLSKDLECELLLANFVDERC